MRLNQIDYLYDIFCPECSAKFEVLDGVPNLTEEVVCPVCGSTLRVTPITDFAVGLVKKGGGRAEVH